MDKPDFLVRLSIVPSRIRIWEVKIGHKFCLTPTCYNNLSNRYEVYLKISRTKCLLDSHPDKPEFSIPFLVGSIKKVDGYAVIDKYELAEIKHVENHG